MPTKEEIEKLAYYLWEQEGRPAGRDVANYYEAERILREREQQAASQAAPSGNARRRPSTGSRRRKA